MSRHARRRRMPARFAILHVRARGVPLTIAGLVVLALLAWAADWLLHAQGSSGPADRWSVAVLAPLLGAVIISAGLGGADEELERTAAMRWRRVRTVHVAVAVAAVGAALALTGLSEPSTFGAYELARNSAACIGLVAVGTAVLGVRLGWMPVVAYVLLVLGMASPTPENAWWTWPIQEWSADSANWAAAVVGVVGALGYVWFGSRASAAP